MNAAGRGISGRRSHTRIGSDKLMLNKAAELSRIPSPPNAQTTGPIRVSEAPASASGKGGRVLTSIFRTEMSQDSIKALLDKPCSLSPPAYPIPYSVETDPQ